jgi:hypothetical protein
VRVFPLPRLPIATTATAVQVVVVLGYEETSCARSAFAVVVIIAPPPNTTPLAQVAFAVTSEFRVAFTADVTGAPETRFAPDGPAGP